MLIFMSVGLVALNIRSTMWACLRDILFLYTEAMLLQYEYPSVDIHIPR